ncbi:MAG: metal ABC transporter ATP-binding protein [Candidatus Portiera sp.]|nr:metal ABC transporter ATP-binding protein [Portiera sp.]
MKYLLECKNLSVDYGLHKALGPLSVKLPKNSKIAMLGPNGAGKSTLLKALTGVTSYKGSLIKNYSSFSYTEQRQEVDWDFPVTCHGVAEMGLYAKVGWFRPLNKQHKKMAYDALAKLGIEDLADRPISQLSVGQQQRVFLARSIVNEEAELFLFDEPLAGVDLKTSEVIYKLFDDLISKGKSIVCVHHNLYDAADYFDHGILINHHLIAQGDLTKVLSKKNLESAYGAGIAVPQFKKRNKVTKVASAA